ncbi:MAG: hypothetical protein HYY63_03760, partial [Elusimicrobia bacterium]|nr:hypothetical protein [Elusimicrobiota bacterium]
PNSNPAGTGLSVSTNAFGIASSTVGIVSGGQLTTMTISGLIPNTAYNLNVGAFDSTGGASTQSAAGNEISTTTLAAPPTITSFRVFTTSITVTLGANGNPVNTSLTISTGTGGHYAVSNSSKGVTGSADVTLVITGLSTNTSYGFQAGTNDSTTGAATQTTVISASTNTLGASPTITSFRVFTTSITVTIGANGNPVGTTLTISTGTGGHYAVSNSSKGIVGSGDVTLVISNLSTATVYGFQAGTNDSSGNAATQTTVITASTSTLAVAPLVSSFQVFATSIVVNINPNSNPAGTGLSVSTNAFGIASSTVGIVSGGQLTTMTISGLIPNTAYNLDVGAFDSTGGASTQSAAGNEISTTTLGAAPSITSFSVFTTSISVTLGGNGNPAGTTLTISTGTGGHYAVVNSSKGIVGSGDVTLVISNLSTATVYGFQAG